MGANEAEWVSRARGGDMAALRRLHTAHAGRVKAYVLRCGFSAADADDLVQEVFERVAASVRAFEASEGDFSAWLAGIARETVGGDTARRRDAESFDGELADEILAADERWAGAPETREALDALAACIDALPAELARTVHLRYVQGRTARGIAAATATAETTVQARLREAAALLEQCLRAKGVID